MPPATASEFADPLHVYLAVMAGSEKNIGQRSIISESSIYNTGGGFTENFTDDLDASGYLEAVLTPAFPVVVKATDKYWLTWTPATTAYTLE